MVNVTKTIIDLQPEWFAGDMNFLRPLKLQDIADKINMDISTISRSTRGKYVETPYGVFELKHYFTDSIEKKISTIRECKLSHYVDDLLKIFVMDDYPKFNLKSFLFKPNCNRQ